MPFLRNAWYVAGWLKEIEDKPLARTFLDEPVVIFRGESGDVAALADMCAHRFAPLSLGRISGETIRCPYHGLVYDKSGACVHNPHGKGARPSALNVRSYPLQIQDGLIWIWMGDPALAATTAAPTYPFLQQPGLSLLSGYLSVSAHYELVTDNLMDLSHVEFLHPFIGVEGSSAGIVYDAKQEGERVSALHRMPGQPNTPLFEKILGDDVKLINGYADTHWEAPANMYLETRAEALDVPGGREAIMQQVHLLTPETEKSTHYIWGITHSRQGDDELNAMLTAGIQYAFEHEDEPMIQAVQERMRNRPLFEMSPALLPMDEAAIRARRILAKRIADEKNAGPTSIAAE